MIIAIHQPNYLPYPGYFSKIRESDTFVFLDNAQFEKNNFTNRNRIRTPQGWCWLTVPLHKPDLNTEIKDVLIDQKQDWQVKHWKSLVFNYGRSPFFYISQILKPIYQDVKWRNLALLNESIIIMLCAYLGVETEFVKASNLSVKGSGTDLLVDICKRLDATTYLSGPSGRNYLELDKFEKEGIKVRFQEFKPHPYPQQFGKEFISNLSIVDMLFNVGELL